MIASPAKLLFLPGASGNTRFWLPVAERLAHPAQHVHIGWPGFGDTPPLPSVTGMDDLVTRVLAEIDRPTALVAQSMGGIVAVLAALERPELITHLTLTVTSGGVDMLLWTRMTGARILLPSTRHCRGGFSTTAPTSRSGWSSCACQSCSSGEILI